MAEQMKPSGIDWIGNIPSDWNAKKVKYVISDIKDGTHGTFDRVESGELLLSAKNVFDDGIRIGENESEISILDYKSIISNGFPKKNDVLLCCVGTIGRCCVYEYDQSIAFQRSVAFLRPLQQTNARYLKYALQSDSTLIQEQFLINKSAQDGLYMGSVRELIIPYPNSKSEQQAIADFLDKECAQIDSIAADLEKQIDLLQQYKKSLITETVTKGLDKSVPMKHSGVEWIGEIPDHWDAKRMKYFLSVSSGDAITNEQLEDGKYPVYGGGKQMGCFNRTNVDKNKILIGRVGANCGCVTITDVPSWATDNALVVQTYCHFKYIYYLLISADLNRLNEANAQPLITGAKVGNCVVSFAKNHAEQERIARYLDEHCEKIENIIVGKQKQLETIRQHKKSLIYEYVTGKKRVKEVQ